MLDACIYAIAKRSVGLAMIVGGGVGGEGGASRPLQRVCV